MSSLTFNPPLLTGSQRRLISPLESFRRLTPLTKKVLGIALLVFVVVVAAIAYYFWKRDALVKKVEKDKPLLPEASLPKVEKVLPERSSASRLTQMILGQGSPVTTRLPTGKIPKSPVYQFQSPTLSKPGSPVDPKKKKEVPENVNYDFKKLPKTPIPKGAEPLVDFLDKLYPAEPDPVFEKPLQTFLPQAISKLRESDWASREKERTKLFRPTLERKIFLDVVRNRDRSVPLTYVGVNSDYLLQDWIILSQLLLLGYKVEAHIIREEREKENLPFQQFKESLTKISSFLSVTTYHSLDDFFQSGRQVDIIVGVGVTPSLIEDMKSHNPMSPKGAFYFIQKYKLVCMGRDLVSVSPKYVGGKQEGWRWPEETDPAIAKVKNGRTIAKIDGSLKVVPPLF